jgi:hypothetical protein
MPNIRGVDICRACAGTELFLALNLGMSPVANRLALHRQDLERVYPLEMRICKTCGFGQLEEFELPENIFSDYPYLSSTSQTWLDENRKFAETYRETLGLLPGDKIIEIASNDGYLLQYFMDLGMNVLGVEPAANVAVLSRAKGIETLVEFFGVALARKLNVEGVSPRLIIAKNVVAHVPDLQDFIQGISLIINSETVVVVEAPSVMQILEQMQFDTIYHEHFSYISATGIQKIFESFGLEIVGAERVSTHGGSTRYLAKKAGGGFQASKEQIQELHSRVSHEERSGLFSKESWGKVSDSVARCTAEFKLWLQAKSHGDVTVAYGAAAKGVTLLAAAGAKPGDIDVVIDNSEEKQGRVFPVVMAPIVSEKAHTLNKSNKRHRYIIFPWNLSGEIAGRIRSFDPDAEIFTAVPELKKVM